MKLVPCLLSNNKTVMRYSVHNLVNYIIYNTYNTNYRRDTAILTSEIYYDILHNVKEINSFWGHLIKGNMANYIYIDTYKIPAYSGTGDNVDTFFIQYSKNLKNHLKLTPMTPGKILSYLFLTEKSL